MSRTSTWKRNEHVFQSEPSQIYKTKFVCHISIILWFIYSTSLIFKTISHTNNSYAKNTKKTKTSHNGSFPCRQYFAKTCLTWLASGILFFQWPTFVCHLAQNSFVSVILVLDVHKLLVNFSDESKLATSSRVLSVFPFLSVPHTSYIDPTYKGSVCVFPFPLYLMLVILPPTNRVLSVYSLSLCT